MSESEAKVALAEEAIAAAFAKLERAFESITVPLFQLSREGRIINCNRAAVRVLECKNKKQLTGKPFASTVFARRSREQVRKLFRQCSVVGRAHSTALFAASRHGNEFAVVTAGKACGDKNPRFCMQTWAVAPLSYSAKNEAAWLESDDAYRKLLRLLPEAVVVYDAEGRILEVSQQALKMYGAGNASEMIGKSAFEVIAGRDKRKAMENIRKSLAKGFVRRKYWFKRKNGSVLLGELSSSVVRDVFGKPKAFIAVIRQTRHK
ncbi:MAG: PAS domain S-box protein [Candidatus Micrarchaeia archaeon]